MKNKEIMPFVRKNLLGCASLTDGNIIIEETLGISRQKILMHPDDEVDAQKLCEVEKRFAELKEGRPLQYIIGKWEFCSISFEVGEGVLIPREDTRAVTELGIMYLKNKQNAVFADLGSGSGAIAVTLALKTDCTGFAVELERAAFEYLKRNATQAGEKLTLLCGDMFSPEIKNALPPLDLVISNPPYISKDEMDKLDGNVKREPQSALFGGDDGLDFYRKISAEYYGKLKCGGMLAFEVGYTQANAVGKILSDNGYTDIRERCDINGIRRAVCALKK